MSERLWRKPVIGLFGTCGDTTWRQDFIKSYDAADIQWYNPQVADWTPEMAEDEAQHLRNDDIVVFPVTDDTYGSGSLAETGYSIAQAIDSRRTAFRFVIVYIAREPKDDLKIDAVAFKESCRARALVLAHLDASPQPNVFVCNRFEDILPLSMQLYAICRQLAFVKAISKSNDRPVDYVTGSHEKFDWIFG